MNLKPLMTVVAVAVLLAGCNQAAKEGEKSQSGKVELNTQQQKLSYIFGHNIGGQFKSEDVGVDVDAFTTGVRDALAGKKSRIDEDEMKTVVQDFQKEQMAKQQEKVAAEAKKNKKEGDAFLKENAKKDGVVTLDSGLQYKVLKEGTGPKPTEDSTVKVDYRGTLIDGTEFDSSYKRGKPATFRVDQVIPGWTQALLMMKEGAKWELFIPPSLAYGPGGTGGVIGPDQTLIFEVELLDASVDDGNSDKSGGTSAAGTDDSGK